MSSFFERMNTILYETQKKPTTKTQQKPQQKHKKSTQKYIYMLALV